MQTIQTILIRHYQTVLIVLLTAIISLTFYMGFLEGKRASSQNVALSCNQNILEKLSIPLAALANPTPAYAATGPHTGAYVGSKNGTKYYHSSLTCTAVKRIKPSNYIWFNSAEDAQLQGYSPGKC